MFKERYRVRQLEYCNKQMFGNLIVTCPTYSSHLPEKLIHPVPITVKPVITPEEVIKKHLMEAEKRRASLLVDQLLLDIHNSFQNSTDYNSTTSGRSSQKYSNVLSHDLYKRDMQDLSALTVLLGGQIERVGIKLVRRLKRREALRRQQEAQCDVITCQLNKLLPNTTEDMCFTVNPQPSESGFSQWVSAMKMVAQLPGGIPPEFRRRLWLTMAEKHLTSKGVDWTKVERTCFSEWSHPDDGELGVQIVKDLHRTGCSLFCGEGGQENQALLKKVLLAYARWNKAVGYCQGFNMLAALILQVTEKSETDALKLMIYLIEGVLPDSYFADSLRGLSVDMAVFRELLRTRLPRLSKHLDLLQNMAKEGTTSYEPPLTNVFTMQWFLTLFCNCLPQPSVLRVWDLILLEGNEILLRTALAIWQALADRIVRVKTADEFYCIMGVLTNELLENNLIDANLLIKSVVSIGPLTELKSLREHYLYNINPWGAMPSPLEFSEKQLKLYPKERMALDISALKKQYIKLKQRQRQAHIIFTAAISRHPPPRTPVAMNHLLIGKSAIVPAKRLGPPKGSIPPMRIPVPSTLHWKDASKHSPSSSSSDTELCDENDPPSEPSDNSNQVSPIHELPEDNPQELETSIDTSAISTETISETDSPNRDECGVSVVFDTLVPSRSQDDVVQSVDLDSEDDSVDFELFLEDRVKCFKQEESPSAEDSRVSLSRRNSERALQIIQENSLILHRILQCQSRLSLSPPLTEPGVDLDDDTLSKISLDSCRRAGDGMFSSSCSSSDTATGHVYLSSDNEVASSSFHGEHDGNFPDFPLPEIPVESVREDGTYRSKYDEILERSRDLNAKYYSQILNFNDQSDNGSCMIPESKTFTNQDELIDFSSDIAPNVEEGTEKCGRIEEDSPSLSGVLSQTHNSSMGKISVPLDPKKSESVTRETHSNECSFDQTHLDKHEASTDAFHLSSIDFFQNLVTCEDNSRVSSSEIFKNHFTDEEYQPKQMNNSKQFDMERTQNVMISPEYHNILSNVTYRGKELNTPLIDFTTDPFCSRVGDTSGYHSKDSGTDSSSISDKDVSSSITLSELKSKLTSPLDNLSFDNISIGPFEKKCLSATNSIERNDYTTSSRKSLSASNSIERATSTSKQNIVGEIFESSKYSVIRLKETIKSPEIPCESSFRSFSGNSSCNNLKDGESFIKYPNIEEKLTTSFEVASPILELKQETPRERLPSSYIENENKFDCDFGVLDNIIGSTEDEVEFSKEAKNRSSNPQNSEHYTRTKSPIQDVYVDNISSFTKSTKVVSPPGREHKSLINEDSFGDHISNSRNSTSPGRNSPPIGVNDEKFGDRATLSPIKDPPSNKKSTAHYSSPSRSSGLLDRSPSRREDHKLVSECYRENSSPSSDPVWASPMRSPSTFISPNRNSPLMGINDEKCGDRSTLSPIEDPPSNKRSTAYSPFPIRSSGLSDRSPSRREDYKQIPESYRKARSPLDDSIVRNLSSPDRMYASPIRSPSSFTSPDRNSPFVVVNDGKFGDRSTLSSIEDPPSNKRSTAYSPSPIRSSGLSDRSPSRQEDYKQIPESYRKARSPLDDSIVRNLSSPERIYASPIRSPSSFTSTDRNSPFVVESDDKFGDRSTLSPIEVPPPNERTTAHFSSSIRSKGLLDRSPSRREDYKPLAESFRGARSPLNDSVVRNLSSPERICPSPMRSPSAGETRSYENVSPKSPNKIFNPFPVPLSSRQNKEVAVKLGLYKK